MPSTNQQLPVLLARVLSLIAARNGADKSELIQDFTTQIYSTLSADDIQKRSDAELYGAAVSLWNALSLKRSGNRYIRVYNPEVSRDGWSSQHTTIEIIVDDMPFQVDSVQMCLERLGLTSHLLLHLPLIFDRDADNQVSAVRELNAREQDQAETVFLIEIDRHNDPSDLEAIANELCQVADDVELVVKDWPPMQERLRTIIDTLQRQPPPVGAEEVAEVLAFLEWIADQNFIMMGYRHYDIQPVAGDYQLCAGADSSLGLMRNSSGGRPRLLSSLGKHAHREALSPHLLVLSKANSMSKVHRAAHIDYIGIKCFNPDGQVIGEDRFIGLYTLSAYSNSALQIPIIRQKLNRIMAAAALKGSHVYKTLLNIFETYPRDELFQAREEELKAVGLGVLAIQERDQTKLFIRRDPFGRYYSCMVYVAKDRYNTQLRQATQKILAARLGVTADQPVEFTVYFSHSTLARTHYVVWGVDSEKEANVQEIECDLIEIARSWQDKLQNVLVSQYGESDGLKLARKYGQAFPPYYRAEILPNAAKEDINRMEKLSGESPLDMLLYQPQELRTQQLLKLKLYHYNQPLHLSDVVPILENMGLRVLGERPYRISTNSEQQYWILDFILEYQQSISLDTCQHIFQQAFSLIWQGKFANDRFNQLVLAAGLNGYSVQMLRAYGHYLHQIGCSFTQTYIARTLAAYPQITKLLIRLFEQRFDPRHRSDESAAVAAQIGQQLEQVFNLDDDRIIRLYVSLMQATMRTNFFQFDAAGQPKACISFKIAPQLLSDLPQPVPQHEIFIYSTRMEGVHLRSVKVARGGIRWSDRREDFRTEILGLLKAQRVKNALIVPGGAKGGFVCKKISERSSPQDNREEAQRCYQLYIRSLLDLTDNIVDNTVQPPVNVRCHDDDDPYLVVAADKGTATFSDLANEIAEEYGFWLGDAFASGGQTGYDHKKMAITARGAWESVQQHFNELGIDYQQQDFSVVGIGDMGGDVFGNGMLLSEHILLKAAFNHQDIFVDPQPDAARSHQERQRLFALTGSTWQDFSAELISAGGGVFSRQTKSIPLSQEMQTLLDVKAESLAPDQLIKAILKMKVDLLWSGGIGTYIKSQQENNLDVNDRSNDAVRINGAEVQAKVIVEGGNLGCTQKGRIEFALHGGQIHTDFIDNAGGVVCSDNEVNIKIFLNQLVAGGDLTRKQRNQLLKKMSAEVSAKVLADCRQQSFPLSLIHNSKSLGKEQLRFIGQLEKNGLLNRRLEHLPTEKEFEERGGEAQGLTPPELSVLIAYAKIDLKRELNSAVITDEPYYQQLLRSNFPQPLQKKYSHALQHHPLRAEIIANRLANQIVNDLGPTFVRQMQDESGQTVANIGRAYTLSFEIFGFRSLWQSVVALGQRINPKIRKQMLAAIRKSAHLTIHWFLVHFGQDFALQATLQRFGRAVDPIRKDLFSNHHLRKHIDHGRYQQLIAAQVPAAIAEEITSLPLLVCLLDIAEIASGQRSMTEIAAIYFQLRSATGIHKLIQQLDKQISHNHWQVLALTSYHEQLSDYQRQLTALFLQQADGHEEKLNLWLRRCDQSFPRWRRILEEFRTQQIHEFAKYTVALRELKLLVQNCQKQCSQEDVIQK